MSKSLENIEDSLFSYFRTFYRSKFLIISISILFYFISFTVVYTAESDNLYLSLPIDNTPLIYKYIFNYNGTLIAQTRNEGVVSKTDRYIGKKTTSIAQDSSLDNSLTITYNFSGEPDKLILKLKEKDKKIKINFFNMLGNKVADVYEDIPGTNELTINLDEHVRQLSNGVYICVVQGINIRLKLYQKFTISR